MDFKFYEPANDEVIKDISVSGIIKKGIENVDFIVKQESFESDDGVIETIYHVSNVGKVKIKIF
jgi:hypothetical protein